jgi:hypothetical protein
VRKFVTARQVKKKLQYDDQHRRSAILTGLA